MDVAEIKTMPLSEMEAAYYNPRKDLKPGEPEYEAIARSLMEFGLVEVLVWNKRTKRLVGGHQRLKILKANGVKEAPTAIVDLSEPHERALNVALNKASGAWDTALLRDFFEDFDTGEIDVTLTGFSLDEIEDLMAPPGAPEEPDDEFDAAAEAAAITKPKSKPGDVWILGDHRVMCGDATSAEHMAKLMAGEKAEVVFTDPPYGVSYDSKAGHGIIKNDGKRDDDLFKMLTAALTLAGSVTTDTAAFYIWHASATRREFEDAIMAAGLLEKQYIICAKPSFVLGHAHYHWQHEPCFYCEKAGQSAEWLGDRSQGTIWHVTARSENGDRMVSLANGLRITTGGGNELYLAPKAPKNKKLRTLRLKAGDGLVITPPAETTDLWEVENDTGKYDHPTQKPVALSYKALKNSSGAGAIALDMFGGSGSTLVGADHLGRRARIMELDPKYVDVIVRRYAKLKGLPEDWWPEAINETRTETAADASDAAQEQPGSPADQRQRAETKADRAKVPVVAP